MAKHKIALIPGDGIGKEVLPEGVRVLEAAGRRFGFELAFTDFDWWVVLDSTGYSRGGLPLSR